MEQQPASIIRWIDPRFDHDSGKALDCILQNLLQTNHGRWIWILEEDSSQLNLLISLGNVRPHRTAWAGELPAQSGIIANEQHFTVSPFHRCTPGIHSLYFHRLLTLGIISDASLPTTHSTWEHLQLHWDLASARQEAALLRQKVQQLSCKLQSQNGPNHSAPFLLHHQQRTESLAHWYHQASQILAASELGSRLAKLAQQAQHLLEATAAIVVIKEGQRARIWGSEPNTTSTIELSSLGPLSHKVLSHGQSYRYQKSLHRQDRFLHSQGIVSALVLPLFIDGQPQGALIFGHSKPHHFHPDEIDLAQLAAYQTALLLENTLLVTGTHVERVVARAVLESMADGVLTLDWERRITSFNPAAEHITGWEAKEAIGCTLDTVLSAHYSEVQNLVRDHDGKPCPILTLLANQELMDKGLSLEGTFQHKTGKTRYSYSSYSIITDHEDLLGAVIVLRDITEQHEREAMKADYATALTHDLKTPLTAIKGYAMTLLNRGHKLDETARHEALEVINFEIDRVSRMFDNLLHQARLEAGIKQRHLSKFSIAKAMRQVLSLYAYSGRQHELSLKVEPEGIEMTTDRDQFDQILNNLVSNAMKYTPNGSHIALRCFRLSDQRGRLRFEIQDDGPGIPEPEIPLVFDRFHRADGASSTRVRGTGLGLHITQQLVKNLEGEIGVTSRLGEGSCFWFELPQTLAEENPL